MKQYRKSDIIALSKLDNLRITGNSKNIPHPVDLARLEGLYRINAEMDVFELTESGRILLKKSNQQPDTI